MNNKKIKNIFKLFLSALIVLTLVTPNAFAEPEIDNALPEKGQNLVKKFQAHITGNADFEQKYPEEVRDGIYTGGPATYKGGKYFTSEQDKDLGFPFVTFVNFGQVSGGELKPGEDYNFSFKFDLPMWFKEDPTIQVEKGDYLELSMEIFEGLYFTSKMDKPVEFRTEGPDSILLAKGYFIEDSTKPGINMNIIFESIPDGVTNIHGDAQFKTQFVLNDNQGTGDIEIDDPYGATDGEDLIVKVPPAEGVDTLLKQGNRGSENNRIDWTIDVNRHGEKLDNIVITDKLDERLNFEKVTIQKVRYKPDGSVIEDGNPVDQLELNLEEFVDKTTNELKVEFNKLGDFTSPENTELNQGYRILIESSFDYEANIPKPGESEGKVFINKVTFDAEGLENPLTDDANVEVLFKKRVLKESGEYDVDDKGNRYINWTIKYNQENLTLNDPFLLDYLDERLSIEKDSFEIKYSDENGELKYDITYNLDDGADFKIQFDGEISKEITVKYKTRINDDVEITGESNFTNKVIDYEGHVSGDIVKNVGQSNISKKHQNINRKEQTVEWVLNLNASRRKMTNVVVKDAFDTPGLTIVGDIEVTGLDGVGFTTEKIDAANSDDFPYGGFTITFDSDETIDRPFSVSFKTKYDVRAAQNTQDYKNTSRFKNCALISYSRDGETSDVPFISTSCDQFDILNFEKNNGNKTGDYNAKTKEFSWEVLINFNNHELKDASLVDVLGSNHSFIKESFEFYSYSVSKDGKVENVTLTIDPKLKNSLSFDNIQDENGKDVERFTLKFEDGYEPRQILVRYKTKPNTDLIESKYTNKAIFNNNGKAYEFNKDVDVKYGSKLVVKGGDVQKDESGYSTGVIKWNVIINPSQSTISGLEIKDIFSSSHKLIIPKDENGIEVSPFKIYETNINVDGSIDKTGVEVSADKYIEDLGSPEDDYTFKIRFKDDIDKAYILTYESFINFGNASEDGDLTVSNKIDITGSIGKGDGAITEGEGKINFYSGSGSAGVKLAELKFSKKDQFNKPVVGAKFKITNQAYPSFTREEVSDENGLVQFKNIPKGKYLIVETDVPLGYEPLPLATNPGNDEGYLIDSELENSEQIPLFNFRRSILVNKQSFTAGKTERNTEIDLSGAEFSLFKATDNETAIETAVSNSKGEVIFLATETEPLELGVEYIIKEVKPLEGHVLNTDELRVTLSEYDWNNENVIFDETNQRPIEVKPDYSAKLEFKNYLGSLEFTKNGEDDKPLLNVFFGLFKSENDPEEVSIFTGTSNTEGIVRIENIPVGEYYLREISAPGHIVNTTNYLIEITNEHKGDVPVSTIDSIKNYKGSVTLTKLSEDNNPLAGSLFGLYSTNDNTQLSTIHSDAQGMVYFDGIEPGKYYLKEIKPTEGYILDQKEYHFTIDESSKDGHFDFVFDTQHINYKGSLNILKTDKIGGPLEFTEFTLYDMNNNKIESKMTDEQGKLSFSNLIPGDYILKETKASDDYVLNTENVRKFNIPTEHTGPVVIEYVFENYQAEIEVIKKDGSQTLSGAHFTLSKDGQNIDTQISGIDGKVIFTNLGPGTYTLVESIAPNGYIRNNKEIVFTIEEEQEGLPVVISDGKVVTEPFEFVNYKGKFILEKKGHDTQLLDGVKFALTGPGHIETEFITVNGKITIDNLAVGHYKLVETETVDGHILNRKPIEFEIVETYGDKQYVVNESMTNEKGSVILTKYGTNDTKLDDIEFELYFGTELVDTYSTIDGMITVNGLQPGDYTFKEVKSNHGYILNTKEISFTIDSEVVGKVVPVELTHTNYLGEVSFNKVTVTGSAIEGVEFTLYDLENNIIAVTYSDKNGLVTFNNLKVGDYIIKETASVDGYILNTEEVQFEIKDSFKGEFETIVLDDFVNYKGSIQFEKVDVDGKPLTGAKFNLIDSKNKVVASTVSDENGLVTFTEVSVGEYTIVETESANGYIINTEMIQVSVDATHQGAPVVIELEAFTNYLGSVQFNKVDKDNNAIKGAEFTLYNAKGKAVASVLSDENGFVLFENVPVGPYTIKETKAPVGYIRNTEIRTFEVLASGKGEPAVVILNDLVNYQGKAIVKKVDPKGNILSGAEFNLLDSNGKVIATIDASSGLYHLENLAPGSYKLVETKAPKGFTLSSKEYKFEIPEAHQGEFEYITITVVNKPLSLPATGISSMIPTAILTMMLGFLFLAVREVQRRRYI